MYLLCFVFAHTAFLLCGADMKCHPIKSKINSPLKIAKLFQFQKLIFPIGFAVRCYNFWKAILRHLTRDEKIYFSLFHNTIIITIFETHNVLCCFTLRKMDIFVIQHFLFNCNYQHSFNTGIPETNYRFCHNYKSNRFSILNVLSIYVK